MYGLCGFEISESYFKQNFAQPTGFDRLSCLLAPAGDGLAADAAMAAGGRVTGIIPRVFIEKEQAHRGITELLEVPDMITRKQKLIESGDAFIVLPGGIGTLEELADTFSHYRIYAAPGSRPPILIANINGIYDPLKALFQNWLRLGFIEKEDLSSIHFCSSLEEIMKILGK